MPLLSAGGEAQFVKMIGQVLQAWIDGDWRMAWAAVAPILVIALLVAALRCFLGDSLDDRRPPFKRRRRPS